jgi:hypothetical protein
LEWKFIDNLSFWGVVFQGESFLSRRGRNMVVETLLFPSDDFPQKTLE